MVGETKCRRIDAATTLIRFPCKPHLSTETTDNVDNVDNVDYSSGTFPDFVLKQLRENEEKRLRPGNVAQCIECLAIRSAVDSSGGKGVE